MSRVEFPRVRRKLSRVGGELQNTPAACPEVLDRDCWVPALVRAALGPRRIVMQPVAGATLPVLFRVLRTAGVGVEPCSCPPVQARAGLRGWTPERLHALAPPPGLESGVKKKTKVCFVFVGAAESPACSAQTPRGCAGAPDGGL